MAGLTLRRHSHTTLMNGQMEMGMVMEIMKTMLFQIILMNGRMEMVTDMVTISRMNSRMM